jgi:hypothetical protein
MVRDHGGGPRRRTFAFRVRGLTIGVNRAVQEDRDRLDGETESQEAHPDAGSDHGDAVADPPGQPTRARDRSAEADLPPARKRRIFDGGFYFITALALTGALLTLVLKGWAVFAEVVVQDVGYILDFAPKVAAGVVISVLLPIFVDPASLNRWVGPERGWQGLALAGAFGAAAPGGPSVVFTLAVGLLAAGADRGAVGAFVTGWALLSLNRTLVWELSFLPYDMVALRLVLALPVPVLVGLAMRRLEARS